MAAYDYDPEQLTAAGKQKIADLPPGGRHFTRSLVFLPASRDHRLLISVGSSCDACEEEDPRRAKILAVDAATAAIFRPLPRACATRCSWPSIP